MSNFDPYELYTPPSSATAPTGPRPVSARRRDRHLPDAGNEIALPELPKYSSTVPPMSQRGFPESLRSGGPPSAASPVQYASGTRPISLNLGPRHAHASVNSSPDPSTGPSAGSSPGYLTYNLKADDYSLPPTADASKGLLDDDTKYPPFPPAGDASPYYRHHFSRKSHPALNGARANHDDESWWNRTFEPPDWKLLAMHTALCMIAFPAISLILPLVRGSIFWVRVYVSLGCSIFGIGIGFSLLNLVRKWLEAAAWATAIHQSVSDGEDGIRVRDLAYHTSDSTSAVTALKLLWDRNMFVGTSRKSRKGYDARPWSLFIAFFLLCLAIGASMAFVLGRVVAIDTNVLNQWDEYREVVVAGDLSEVDIEAAKAQDSAFNNFVRTWTLAPFASSENQGRAVSKEFEGDTVYFADATPAQLKENGHGMGTFQLNGTASKQKRDFFSGLNKGTIGLIEDVGQLLHYPKWGIRIHCDSLPEAPLNIVPAAPSNTTYVFLPKKTVSGLFSSFNMDMPQVFNEYNASARLAPGDSFPNGSDPSSWATGTIFSMNGVAHSFWSMPIVMGGAGTGWVQLETVLVRLNTSYVPKGNFPLYNSEELPDVMGRPTKIGYDVAVCLELYEPWVVETYNSTTGLPTTRGVVAKSNVVTNQAQEKRKGKAVANVERRLNSTGKWPGFVVAHDNSVNQMVKDNGRDNFYVPSPTVVSFTDGSGPEGYTSLSASRFGQARALADAANVLPFLAGTGTLVARAYDDTTQAYVTVGTAPLIVALGVALLFGILAGVFTPRLPLNIPRREFGMYSWLAVLHGDALLREMRSHELDRGMDVRDVAKRVGSIKVRYVV